MKGRRVLQEFWCSAQLDTALEIDVRQCWTWSTDGSSLVIRHLEWVAASWASSHANPLPLLNLFEVILSMIVLSTAQFLDQSYRPIPGPSY
jgi:hypothetical protein